MSNEALGWAFKHSPYRGSAYAVHLALADIVNDVHHNEVWVVNSKLAGKARVSRQQVNEVLAGMVSDGFLEVVERPEKGTRQSVRYRFLMPEWAPKVFSWDAAEVDSGVETAPYRRRVVRDDTSESAQGVVRGDMNVSCLTTPNPPSCRESRHEGVVRDDTEPNRKPNNDKPNREPNGDVPVQAATVVDLFGDSSPSCAKTPQKLTKTDKHLRTFMAMYPDTEHRCAEEVVRTALAKALRFEHPPTLFAGLERWCDYWRDSGTERRLIQSPTNWLGSKKWKVEPPSVRRPGRRSSTDERMEATRRVAERFAAQEAAGQ